MPKKAIDSRIPALIRNGAQEKKRSFFVVVGDRQKDVIVNLYHILLNVDVKLNKSVLWAYKNKLLGFSSHRKKREKKIKSEIKRGIRDIDTEDPFELFVSTQNIRYVYYKETDKILGNTYGMCILQDFEALTPNLLARTIETVEGGGLVILLLKGMSSLKQLYTLSMDIHSRYRTEAHSDVVARFNERFILSLGKCDSCLVVDDELNVLPISGGKHVRQLPPPDPELEGKTPKAMELAEIKESLADSPPVGDLIKLAKTVDQAKALLTFVDAIVEKTLRSTVTLTAARGRGKSAALGVAVAAAVAHGYNNIYITSPSPENLKTLFEFVLKGFDALGYVDHQDYNIMQSAEPDQAKVILRINLHRQHRQVIQYIKPEDAHVLGQAELLVIDEAAAIPLPLVRKLMGPYLVFMASTINGYEGTGRSLSLKLIQQLRDQSRGGKSNGSARVVDRSTGKEARDGAENTMAARSLREITLSEPIRYAQGDSVERWMNDLLCLDATLPKSRINTQGCPHPKDCQLLHVNRDTLFSYNPAAEKFLQKMMALYVASHYKNTPNDLQLMSDAPAHQLFVLIAPAEDGKLPEPLCVIQVALEGQISKESVLSSLSRGQRAGGDLIPWIVSQQFQDENFATLSGARIVRIATNPDYVSMGYGSRALELLVDFYDGKLASLSEQDPQEVQEMRRVTENELEDASLLQDNVKVRDANEMPPLFARLPELKAPQLDYVGVSYGLTQQLHKFWKRKQFVPVYLRQTPNDLTGEHTCIMLRSLETTSSDGSWVAAFTKDFQKRFLSLLSYQFRTFPSVTSLSIEESASAGSKLDADLAATPITKAELDALFTPFDLKRLDSYANNMLDYHVILDMLPPIAHLYFSGRLKSSVTLSGVQRALLLAIGLQRKEFSDVEKELNLSSSQLMAMFVKVVRKAATAFRSILEGAVEETMPEAMEVEDDGLDGDADAERRFKPLDKSLQEELDEGGDEVLREERERARNLIDALPLHKYEIGSGATDWQEAEGAVKKATKSGKTDNLTVAVKTGEKKRKVGEAVEEAYKEAEKFKEGAGGKKKKHKSSKK